MLFRHFPAKVELFRAAVFQPFRKVAEAFLEEFERRAQLQLGVETPARDYVAGLYGFLWKIRFDVLSLIAAYAHDPEVLGYAIWSTEVPSACRGGLGVPVVLAQETTGSFHDAAMLSDSWKAPMLLAPSSEHTTVTRSSPRT